MLKSTIRLLLLGSLFTVLFVGVSRVLALSANGEIHDLAQVLLTEMRRSDALQQRFVVQTESMSAKTEISAEYIAGRLTLQETAEQFREADALVKSHAESLVAPYITPETEQALYQQIEVWIENVLISGYSSQQADEVRCRLEAEMCELFPNADVVD